jgi:hypothetical protein
MRTILMMMRIHSGIYSDFTRNLMGLIAIYLTTTHLPNNSKEELTRKAFVLMEA